MEGSETPTSREPSLGRTKPVPRRRKSVMSQSEMDIMDIVTPPFSAEAQTLRERSLDKTKAKAVPQRRKSVMSQSEMDVTDKVTPPFSAEVRTLRERSLDKTKAKAVPQRRKSVMSQSEMDVTDKVTPPFSAEARTLRERSLDKTKAKSVPQRRKSVMSQSEMDIMDIVTPPFSAEAQTLRERSLDKTNAKAVPRRRKSAMSQSEMDIMDIVTPPFSAEAQTLRERSLDKTKAKAVPQRRKSVMSQSEMDIMDIVTPPFSAEAQTLRERSLDKTNAKAVPRRRKSAMSQSEMDIMDIVTPSFSAEAQTLRERSLGKTNAKAFSQRRKSVMSQSEMDVLDKVTPPFSAEARTLRERSLDKTNAKAVPRRRKSVTSELEIDVMDKVTSPSSAEAPALREPSLHKPKAVAQRRKSALMRQLEIDMTEKVKSPLPAPDNGSVSRYGRARKVRCLDSPPENASPRSAKSPKIAARSVSPARSPTVYRMNASNSPVKVVASNSNVLDPIDDLKQTKIRLSDCAEASPKIRRKSAQNREEKTGSLLKCMFSPVKSKSPHNSTRLNIILQRSPDNFDIEKPVVSSQMNNEKKIILTAAVKKFSSPVILKRSEKKSPKAVYAERKTLSPRQQGLIEHPSVIKTLDFNDSPKNVIKIDKPSETKIPAQPAVAFTYDPDYEEMEKNCKFQANDLAWARVGTYPFWPCLITRDPYTGWIVKQKGSSRTVQLMHVSYLADNGRRGWISVSMLREFHGLREFEEARNAITPERKKKDPKLYAAFFISDKSRKTWNLAVKEAEILLATPNFSRIDVLYEMVYKPNKQISKEVVTKIPQKEKKRVSNENRRISLSASLLDTLFSEGPSKTDEKDKSKSTFDVSDVVTACLDDMATKTGNIKIQKQSHMDRWLQKAKSKTPEKAVENAKISAQSTYTRKKKRDGTSDDTELSHNTQSAKRRLRSSSKYSLRADSSSGLESEESKTNSLDEKLPRVSVSTEINQRESCNPELALETHEEQGFVPMTESKINKDNAYSQETASKMSSNSGTNKKNYKTVVANPADDNNKNTEQKIAQTESEYSTDNDDLNIILKMDENSFDSDVSPGKKNRKVTNAKQHESIEPVNIIEKNKFAHLNNDHTYDDKPASDGNADVGNLKKNSQNENQNNMVQSFLTEPENADESSVSSSSMSAEGPMYIVVVENSRESFGHSLSSASIKNTEIDTKCQAVSVKDTISTNGDKTIGEINNFGHKSQDFPNLMNNHIDCNLGNENPKESANYAEDVISQLDGEDVATNQNIEDFDKTSVDSLDICTVKDNVPIIENNCKRNPDLKSSGNTIIISNNIRNDHNYFHNMTANVSLVKCAIKERKLEKTLQFEVTSESDKETEYSEEKSETSMPVLNFDSCNENSLTKKSLVETLHVKSDSNTESSKHIQTKNTKTIQREQTIESSEANILEINNTIQSNEIGSTKQDFVDFEPDSDTESGKANNHFLDALSEDSSSSNSEILKNTNQYMITPTLSLMDESSEVHVPSNEIDKMKTYARQNDEDVMADTLEPIESKEMSDSDIEEFTETDSSRPESEIIEKIEVNMKKIRTYLYAETSDVDTRESSIDGEPDIHDNLESVPIIGSLSTDDSKSSTPCDIEAVHCIEQQITFREKKEAMSENDVESIDQSKCDSSCEAEPTKRINENLESFSILGILSTDESKSTSPCNIEAVNCIEQDVIFQEEKNTIPVNDTQSIKDPKCDSSCEAKPMKSIYENLESVSIGRIIRTNDFKSNIPCNKEVVHCIEQDVKFQDKDRDTMPISDTQNINDPKCDSSCEAKPTKRIHENLESGSVVRTLSTDNSKSTSPCNIEATHCIEQKHKFQKEKDKMPVKITKDPKCDSSCEAEPTNSIHENLESISTGSCTKVRSCNVKAFHCTEQNIKFQERKDKTSVNELQSIKESTSDSLCECKTEPTNQIEGDFKSEDSVPADDECETRNPSTRNVGADSKIEERICVNDGKNVNEANSAKSCDKEVAINNEDDLKIQENPDSTPSETTDNTAKSSTSTSSSFVNHTEINKNATVCKVDFQSTNELKNTRPSEVKCLKINIESHEKVDDSSDNDSDDISCDIIPKNLIENDIKIKVKSKVISTNDIPSTDSSKSASLDVNSEIHIHNTEVSKSSINYKVDSCEPASTSIEKRTSSRVKAKDNSDVSSEGLQKDIGTENVTRRSVDAIKNKTYLSNYDDPDFMSYVETKKSMVMEKYPNITAEDSITFLYSIWLLSNDSKLEKEINIKSENPVIEETAKPKRKSRPKEIDFGEIIIPKDKPVRKRSVKTYFENYSDSESEMDNETAKTDEVEQIKSEEEGATEMNKVSEMAMDESWFMNELTKPKPNLFKGLIKERLCEICELPGDIVKCKGHCGGMYHTDCVRRQAEPQPEASRKKKKKQGRPRKSAGDSDQSSDGEKSQEVSLDETNLIKSFTVENENFETQLAEKMMVELEKEQNIDLDLYSTDEDLDWDDVTPGQCEIVNVEPRLRSERKNDDLQYFKCNDCQNYYQSPCFICKSVESPKHKTQSRQKCSVMHCSKVYHLECLDHWPQTQFSSGGLNKESEAITCPRHVCHTCVCDDPRGCKTRFSGDKLARCVRCPAVYHSFTKCLPAGTKILNGSHIICPRHYEQKPGKVPYHVNTSWCFICATGGTLICCEYCPMSFHADCLNIQPPEDGYMCEDCETGRLPLYGEMVWAKLGNYRWWPGLILHPHLVPDNVTLLKHSTTGEFVVRFFGGNDHFWLYRGRVFPYQEGDTGKCSTQKSKIDTEFVMAVEQAQRIYKMLKEAKDNEEESVDIASSMLPPHYVKLKVNKPHGSLAGRRIDVDEENSGTQCDCRPDEDEPCSAYSQCLNRVLLTECGPACRAGDRCNNRNFEKRNYPKLAPRRTPQRGWGLHTLEDIKKGQFVIEYVGELIDDEEFRRRMRRKHETRDENYYFLTLDKDRMIDAGPKGNAARFMNHCCEPNCETQKWTVLGDVRVGLFAICDIPANSEVTFNYNLECASVDKKKCLCGAGRCAGYIGAKPKQEEPQVKKPKRKYNKKPRVESPSTSAKTPPVRKYRSSNTSLNASLLSNDLLEIEQDLLIIQNATRNMPSDGELDNKKINKESKPIDAEAKEMIVEEIKLISPTTECKKVENRSPKIVKETKVKMSFDEEMMKIDDYTLKKKKEKKDKTLSPDGKVNVGESPKKKRADEIVKVNGIEDEKEQFKSKKTTVVKLEKLKSPDDRYKNKINGHRKEKKRSDSREKIKELQEVGTKLDKVEKNKEEIKERMTFECPEKRTEESCEKSVSEDLAKSETADVAVKRRSKKTTKRTTLTDGEMNGFERTRELRVSVERCDVQPHAKDEKRALKRKRVSFSSEEIVFSYDESTGEKKTEVKKTEEKDMGVKMAKTKAGSAYEQVFFEFLKKDTSHSPVPGNFTKSRKLKRLDNV